MNTNKLLVRSYFDSFLQGKERKLNFNDCNKDQSAKVLARVPLVGRFGQQFKKSAEMYRHFYKQVKNPRHV